MSALVAMLTWRAKYSGDHDLLPIDVPHYFGSAQSIAATGSGTW